MAPEIIRNQPYDQKVQRLRFPGGAQMGHGSRLLTWRASVGRLLVGCWRGCFADWDIAPKNRPGTLLSFHFLGRWWTMLAPKYRLSSKRNVIFIEACGHCPQKAHRKTPHVIDAYPPISDFEAEFQWIHHLGVDHGKTRRHTPFDSHSRQHRPISSQWAAFCALAVEALKCAAGGKTINGSAACENSRDITSWRAGSSS